METKMNSYLGRGRSDYLYAKAGMSVGEEYGDYNGVASMCAQAAEKYLKAIIEKCVFGEDTISLLKSHNLRAILNAIKEVYPNIDIATKDVKWLGDFYFDARYPGDNFIQVSREDALECLGLVEKIEQEVKEILKKEEESRKEQKKKISSLKTFIF